MPETTQIPRKKSRETLVLDPLSRGLDAGITVEIETGLKALETSVDSLLTNFEEERNDLDRLVALSRIEERQEDAMDALLNCLGSEDEAVREEAIKSLVEIGDPAIGPLIKASRDPALREAAVVAMEQLRDRILSKLSS